MNTKMFCPSCLEGELEYEELKDKKIFVKVEAPKKESKQ